MKYTAKKKYGNLVSVRDYVIEKCIKSKVPLTIVYENEEMTIGLDQLEKRWGVHSREFKSKFNRNQTYKLYDFVFKPKEKDEDNKTAENYRLWKDQERMSGSV